jgi:hypothetical protein
MAAETRWKEITVNHKNQRNYAIAFVEYSSTTRSAEGFDSSEIFGCRWFYDDAWYVPVEEAVCSCIRLEVDS